MRLRTSYNLVLFSVFGVTYGQGNLANIPTCAVGAPGLTSSKIAADREAKLFQ
jgi:hypothetical protein